MAASPAGALRRTAPLAGKLNKRNNGMGLKRDSWLSGYVTTPNRPVMWRVYARDDPSTRKNEELFQGWRGVVDFAYRRPYGQVQHPQWMRQAFADKKLFDLEPETSTERIYLGFTANYIWSHWSRRGTSIPPVQILELAIAEAASVKDLGYATKMLRTYREYFNVHFEHDLFTAYMEACLRVGSPDTALYALNQARWLGFATVKEHDRKFLKGEVTEHGEFTYEEHVEQALAKLAADGNPHEEPIAEKQDFSPFAKFWRQHETEQGWWVMPWDKDPDTKIMQHFWRHPANVDPRHGSASMEWTAHGTPLATDAYGVPTDPLGDAALSELAGGDEELEQ
eukprot:TRINITY_DN3003_c1_g1_i1.p1 TRINITY_DN3003_c1_g1~~TRINITY_DN3003_c1_g1_i1.p1  ORF type:complete len:338 (+),score=112.06 TRINITY_DN3003_c1_g1_i1:78-1091(+)